MRKNLTTLVLAVFTATSVLFAQVPVRNCATMDYLDQQMQADPSLQGRMQKIENQMQQWIQAHPTFNGADAIVTIPVVFHVVYNTSAQNISDARILEQLHVLNLDYSHTNADVGNTPSVFSPLAANTGIQFCMAQRDPAGNATTGIERRSTTVTSFSQNDNMKHYSTGGLDAWAAGSYLNIWVCNMSGGILGYAQFPGGSAATDGVALLYSSVGGPAAPGTANPYHLGRTATHEVGHWLNLRHIWGDANCGNDQVGDTPTQQTSNFGCPSFPHVTCSNGPNGDMFMNYMDYTDDNCMNMFSAGQSTRANSAVNTYRSTLLSSLGCVAPTGGGCGTPSGLNATSIANTSATLNWSAVATATSYNVQYRQTGTGNWTSTTSTTTSKSLTGLVAGTSYDYQVQAVCTTTGVYSSIAAFTTTGGSGGCNGDPYETNNTKATAKPIAINTDIYALISSSSDKDYFSFTTLTAAPKLKVTLDVPADFDLILYNGSGSNIGSSSKGGTTSEAIAYNSATVGANYKCQVFGYAGAQSTSCYHLKVTTGTTNFKVLFDNSNDPSKAAFNEELTVYPNPANDHVTILFNSDANQSTTIQVVDMLGKIVQVSNVDAIEGDNKVDMNIQQLQKGIYMMQVKNGEQVYNFRFTVDK